MNYDLVFEGGGAKGMVFVGALEEFEARGHTYDRLLGTSAGAITAALLAAGYDSQEMLVALNETVNGRPVFSTFMGAPEEFEAAAIENSVIHKLLQAINLPVVPGGVEDRLDYWLAKTLMQNFRHLFSFIERGGWYSAQKFREWLGSKLDEGTFQDRPRSFSRMTLSQFHQATGRELSLVVSDTTGGRMLVLNHRTAPGLPVVWAVRMSMSIPLIWPEVEWQAEWGTYLERDISGHLLVDGGLLSNFPIELFVSEAAHITAVMGQKRSDDILGLLIDEDKPVAGASTVGGGEDSGFDPARLQLVQRFDRLVDTAIGAHDKMVIEAFERLVVRLPAQGYGTTDFDMSDERRAALVSAGREAMRAYFQVTPPQEAVAAELVAAPSYELDVVEHADRLAGQILAP